MPLIKEIETALMEVAQLPESSQKEIAVAISRMVVMYDDTLTMTPAEQGAQRDNELESFRGRFAPGEPGPDCSRQRPGPTGRRKR